MTKAPQDHKNILFIRHLNMVTAYKVVVDYLVARQRLHQALQVGGEGRSDSFYYIQPTGRADRSTSIPG